MNENIKDQGNGYFEVEKKKTVRLWKWTNRDDDCPGCYFEDNDSGICKTIDCEGSIYKTEKPEPEFVDVEVDD